MLSVTHLPRVACVALSDQSGLLFNLLHANISIHILHTVPYTFLKVLTRRTCLTIKGLILRLMTISFILTVLINDSVVLITLRRN